MNLVSDLPSPRERAMLEELAVDLARTAGQLIVAERPGALGVERTKSSPTDVVTVMDQAAQDHLLHRLAYDRPEDGVLGEEDGGTQGRSGITWVIDPIDGTVNYLYEIPAYAVSVAAVVGDPNVDGAWWPVAGAVFNPVTGEFFHARLGGGAVLEGVGPAPRTLRVSECSELAQALVATGFGYDSARRQVQAQLLVDILPAVRDIRREGSAALDLCHVAAGRLDGYYESGLNAWDLAAGWLIAAEAGALVGGPECVRGSDPSGPEGRDTAAGNLDLDAPTGRLLWAAGPALAPSFRALLGRTGADRVLT